jgi:heptaprenyl diphosphate synthase
MVHRTAAGDAMKGPEKFRIRRREIYENLFSARALCIAGLLIMPALLFNPNTLFRILQFFCFWFLAWLSGKKNNPLITILVMLFIVLFNLIVPYGQVLVSIGPFKITSGALMAGIHRAVTLEALIMISRLTIRRDLKIPGAFGELIGESFRIFALIMDRKQGITRKYLMGDIDRLMLELSEDGAEAPSPAGEAVLKRTGAPGFIILAVIVLLAWSPWVFMLFVLN